MPIEDDQFNKTAAVATSMSIIDPCDDVMWKSVEPKQRKRRTAGSSGTKRTREVNAQDSAKRNGKSPNAQVKRLRRTPPSGGGGAESAPTKIGPVHSGGGGVNVAPGIRTMNVSKDGSNMRATATTVGNDACTLRTTDEYMPIPFDDLREAMLRDTASRKESLGNELAGLLVRRNRLLEDEARCGDRPPNSLMGLTDLQRSRAAKMQLVELERKISNVESELAQVEASCKSALQPFLRDLEEFRVARSMQQNAPRHHANAIPPVSCPTPQMHPRMAELMPCSLATLANTNNRGKSGGGKATKGKGSGTGSSVVAVRDESRDDDMCTNCGTQCVVRLGTASLLCPKCAVARPHMDGVAPFGRETDTSVHYKRINHFKEAIQLIQGKEGTAIPRDTLECLLREICKDGFVPPSKITKDTIRMGLKRLSQTNNNLKKYYENEAQIHFMLTGIPPPRITTAQEERICLRFHAIQKPFQKHKPPERKNFFSYSYLLYKISDMEGWMDLLPHFRLHKGAEKRRLLDAIWKKICEELHNKDPTLPWIYRPTPPPPKIKTTRGSQVTRALDGNAKKQQSKRKPQIAE